MNKTLIAFIPFVSAKFEENEEKIPTISTLNGFVHNVFSVAEFNQMELLLLNFFCWNLDLPTPVNFMEFYLIHAISAQDCQSGRSIEDCSKPMAYTRKYVHYFLEIALQGMLKNIVIFSENLFFKSNNINKCLSRKE